MGQSARIENALWFANDPSDAWEDPTFERNRLRDYVAAECAAVRSVSAGRVANFAKRDQRRRRGDG